MESNILIAINVVLAIVSGVLIYWYIKLNKEIQLFKSQCKTRDNQLAKRFTQINKRLNTIPNVNKKIDTKISELVNSQKEEIEKYVIDSFKKIDSDIVFTSVIDNCVSKTISLKTILENKKDTIQEKFQKIIGNMDDINMITHNATNAIQDYKGQINTEFEKLKSEVEKYNDNYLRGQQLKDKFEKRIANLEDLALKKGSDSKGSRSSSSSQTDTFGDDSFVLENSEKLNF
ncbi:MAG: hypothetical protein U9Q33_13480, partial [Campylobacterota bacterium]|nr:hypothetical protein [Campylobacterota bacterium]